MSQFFVNGQQIDQRGTGQYFSGGAQTHEAATVAYTLTAAAGSFTLTGSAVTLTIARKLAAASGSFSLTGSAVTFTLVEAEEEPTPAPSGLGGGGGKLRRKHKPAWEWQDQPGPRTSRPIRVDRHWRVRPGIFQVTGRATTWRLHRRLQALGLHLELVGTTNRPPRLGYHLRPTNAPLVILPGGARFLTRRLYDQAAEAKRRRRAKLLAEDRALLPLE